MKITKKEIFAFCFNICLLLLTIVGIAILAASGESAGEILKYYTTDSNLLLGIAAMISIICMILKWTGNIKDMPLWANIVKLTATATVAQTMTITILFLTPSIAINPLKDFGVRDLYIGSNLIYHVLSPTLAIVTLLLFEDCKKIKLIKTLYCLIPTIVYAIFYIAMTYTHINPDGTIMEGYDWYGFASFGNVASAFIAIAVAGLYYLLVWSQWLGNRKINLNISNKRDAINLGCYILQAILQIIGVILLFTLAIEKKHKTGEIYYEIADWTNFKWFTTDSNVIMLIVSIISIVFMCLKMNGKVKKLPMWLKICRLIAVAMLTLTMLVIFGFTIGSSFLPSVEMTLRGLYMNSNAFHHVICPTVAIVTFLLFDDCKDIPIKKTLYCLIPIVIYGIFYMAMAYTHIDPNGGFLEGYDWYRFCSFGPIATPFIAIAVIGAFYLFNWLLWLGNRKINLKCLQEKKTRRI